MATALATDGVTRRASPRRDIYLWGSIRALGSQGAKFLVLNLSKHGLMAEVQSELRPGQFVEVMLPGIVSVRARVVWSERKKVGLNFLAPIAA